jgi:hypothetical protein
MLDFLSLLHSLTWKEQMHPNQEDERSWTMMLGNLIGDHEREDECNESKRENKTTEGNMKFIEIDRNSISRWEKKSSLKENHLKMMKCFLCQRV